MSILIKGMEMPKDCIVCPFGWSGCNHQHEFVYMGERPSDCPLVPVPPHGRLIDADALRKLYEKWKCDEALGLDIDTFYIPTPVVRQTIDDAPTVIEAEEDQK